MNYKVLNYFIMADISNQYNVCTEYSTALNDLQFVCVCVCTVLVKHLNHLSGKFYLSV